MPQSWKGLQGALERAVSADFEAEAKISIFSSSESDMLVMIQLFS